MSKFQNILNDMIKESGKTIYSLAADSGIERSYLSKILSGKRKMSIDKLIAVIDAVCIKATKREEIINSYIDEVFGKENFEKFYESLLYSDAVDTLDKTTAVTEITDDMVIFNSKRILLNYAEYFLSDKNQSSRIYTYFPMNELLDIAVKKTDCDFRCIIDYGLEKNVSAFDLINLNVINCICYINETGSMRKETKLLYPYVIITDEFVLFAAYDLKSGYYIKNAELADLYARQFDDFCKKMKVTSKVHNDILEVREPIYKYMMGRKNHKALSLFGDCALVFFMNRNDWDELARTDLPERGYLINTTYEYYQKYFHTVKQHGYISSVNGLDEFCRTGIINMMPPEYCRQISIETRIAILERLKNYITTHPESFVYYFFREDFLKNPKNIFGIEFSIDEDADYQATMLAYFSVYNKSSCFPGSQLFISTDKKIITEFNEFFELLQISDKVMTKEETIAVLDDRIERMKYTANNINSAIEE